MKTCTKINLQLSNAPITGEDNKKKTNTAIEICKPNMPNKNPGLNSRDFCNDT
jgi:hypothetical protein